MSHKEAKRIRKDIRFFLSKGMAKTDPRLARWAEASPRQARRAIAVVTRGES